MGVTIHYQGSLASLDQIEQFEDRVLELALKLGGDARVWRSAADDRPDRIVRGLMLNLYPGQDSVSLLVSPEGWLINLFDIEEAENGELEEPSSCFVKTQFGPLEGHVVLIELLAALQARYFPDLQIDDEGGYWPNRDLETLRRNFGIVGQAIEGLADGLRQYGLSAEAAESPEILASRIARLAELVHRNLSQPAPPTPPLLDERDAVSDDDEVEYDELQDEADEGTPQDWDEDYRASRRRQERLHRAVNERLARGESPDEALRGAFRELGLPDLDEALSDLSDDEDEFEFDEELDAGEPWRESLPEAARDEEFFAEPEERHPLQTLSQELTSQAYKLFANDTGRLDPQAELLLGELTDMAGGLIQGLGIGDNLPDRRHAVPQLKRVLRNAATARAALARLSHTGGLPEDIGAEWLETLNSLEDDTLTELRGLLDETDE
ncbi:MAG: hypothetical protein J5I93_03675 [Pirellulaceae bacterium]|nr:hypothetical protein [Pirellulaceae bacterium]